MIGDAPCTFNPVHAQGMSAAAKHARLLGDVLAERLGGPRGLDGLASEFFVRAAELNRTPWDLARLVAEVFHLVRPLSALMPCAWTGLKVHGASPITRNPSGNDVSRS